MAAEVAYETVEVPKGIERPRRINGACILRIFVTFRSDSLKSFVVVGRLAQAGESGRRRISTSLIRASQARQGSGEEEHTEGTRAAAGSRQALPRC